MEKEKDAHKESEKKEAPPKKPGKRSAGQNEAKDHNRRMGGREGERETSSGQPDDQHEKDNGEKEGSGVSGRMVRGDTEDCEQHGQYGGEEEKKAQVKHEKRRIR